MMLLLVFSVLSVLPAEFDKNLAKIRSVSGLEGLMRKSSKASLSRKLEKYELGADW